MFRGRKLTLVAPVFFVTHQTQTAGCLPQSICSMAWWGSTIFHPDFKSLSCRLVSKEKSTTMHLRPVKSVFMRIRQQGSTLPRILLVTRLLFCKSSNACTDSDMPQIMEVLILRDGIHGQCAKQRYIKATGLRGSELFGSSSVLRHPSNFLLTDILQCLTR